MRSLANKKIILILGVLLVVTLQTALAEKYDDFSAQELDLTKWSESTSDFGFPEEHITRDGAFYITQTIEKDTHHNLIMLQPIQPEQTLEYDVNYVSGAGNNLMYILINDISTGPLTDGDNGGAIGFWNTPGTVGTEFGTYHMKWYFTDNSFTLEATKPDQTLYTLSADISQLGAPYNIKLKTITGADGTIDVSYDNFVIRSDNNITYGVELDREEHIAKIKSGETAEFTLTITNTGGAEDIFELSIDKNPRSAQTSFSENQITLSAGESKTFALYVSAEDTGAHPIWVKAKSINSDDAEDSIQTVTIVSIVKNDTPPTNKTTSSHSNGGSSKGSYSGSSGITIIEPSDDNEQPQTDKDREQSADVVTGSSTQNVRVSWGPLAVLKRLSTWLANLFWPAD